MDGFRRMRRHRLAMASLVVIVVYVTLTVFLYVTELFNYQFELTRWDAKVGKEYEPPSSKYIFGTDFLGRSVFRETLYGAKVSMSVAFVASIISLGIGVPLGAVAGYFRGFIDEIIVWLYTTLSSIPYILLILAFALVLKDKRINLEWAGLGSYKLAGISTVYLAIGLTSWVGICRLIRGEVIKHKDREYVLAARSYGCSHSRIILKHLMPNVFHLVTINFSLQFVSFIRIKLTN